MTRYQFKQVDVFTTQPFFGNPVAVVLGADTLTAADVQRIATWTNLSETTFVLSPTRVEADYRLRIFTPKGELPFAGHPTVGSAHAVLESGLVQPHDSQLVQECEAGLLPLRIEKTGGNQGLQHIFVQTPEAKVSTVDQSQHVPIASALQASLAPDTLALRVDIGPVWLIVQLENAQAVHGLQPDMAAITRISQELQLTGITVFGLTGTAGSALYTRSFAPAANVPEDPVCGSGNASVAAFLMHSDKLSLTGETYTANQGQELGREGFVHVHVTPSGQAIEIGGASVTCIEGSLQV
jgi:PhzF family phenazine biosynthesis protein